MRPFWCYYGAKWRLARHYPAPAFDVVIEPFAGAAGYSLFNEPKCVILNDSDSTVAGLWAGLMLTTPDELRSLPDLTPEVRSMRQTIDEAFPDLERWQLDLIGWWINKGTERPFRRPSKWIREGWRPKSSWGPEVREVLAGQQPKIAAASTDAGWHIHNTDYRRMDWPFLNQDERTWFVDPPYVDRGSRYVHGSNRIDYGELAEWCRSLPGQVIVCENEGADWLPFRPLIDAKTSRTRRSSEVIWTND